MSWLGTGFHDVQMVKTKMTVLFIIDAKIKSPRFEQSRSNALRIKSNSESFVSDSKQSDSEIKDK